MTGIADRDMYARNAFFVNTELCPILKQMDEGEEAAQSIEKTTIEEEQVKREFRGKFLFSAVLRQEVLERLCGLALPFPLLFLYL